MVCPHPWLSLLSQLSHGHAPCVQLCLNHLPLPWAIVAVLLASVEGEPVPAPDHSSYVFAGSHVDLESQAEGKKEVEADDVMRSGPRPIVPYSSMFCLSPTNL